MSARIAFLLLTLSVAAIDQTFSATNHISLVYNEPKHLQRFNTLSQHGDHSHPDLLGEQLVTKSTESVEKSAEQKNEYNVEISQHDQPEPSFISLDQQDHVQQVSTEHESQGHTERKKSNPENQTPESKESQETTTLFSPTLLNLGVATVTTTEQITSHTTPSPTASSSAEETRSQETHAEIRDAPDTPTPVSTTPVTVTAGHGHHSAASTLQGFSTTTIILIGVLAVTKVLWN